MPSKTTPSELAANIKIANFPPCPRTTRWWRFHQTGIPRAMQPGANAEGLTVGGWRQRRCSRECRSKAIDRSQRVKDQGQADLGHLLATAAALATLTS